MSIAKADRRFRRYEPYLGTLISTGVFSVLGKSLTIFGSLGWPESIFLGLVAGCVLMLTIAAGMAAWRYFRPRESSANDSSPDLVDRPDILDGLVTDISRQTLENREELLSLSGSVTAVTRLTNEAVETQEKLNEMLVRRLDKLESAASALASQVGELKDNMAQQYQGLNTRIGDLNTHVNSEKDALRESVHAIYLREQMAGLAQSIESDTSILSDSLHEGETYDQEMWLEWETVHNRWEASVRSWASMGKWFAPNVESRIFTIDDTKYSNGWAVRDTQFPNSEAVRRYKRHRIIANQWAPVRLAVEQGVISVAFGGLRSDEVRRG